MSMRNPYEQQRENIILTASREELTLMLYDGALKFVNQAIIAIEANDNERSHHLIIKAENIILEFRSTLNMEYELSGNLDQMYIYMYNRLVDANIRKDTAILEEVRNLLRDFRDAWKEAMISWRKESAAGQARV